MRSPSHVERLAARAGRLPHRVRRSVQGRIARVHPAPILVFGNQKSGTSAIAHLLADYAGLTKTIDIPDVWMDRVGPLLSGGRPFADVVKRNRVAFSAELIKEPQLTFLIGDVLHCFPESPAVFVVRHPYDNIRSILDREQLGGQQPNIETSQLSARARAYFDAGTWGACDENYIGQLAVRWNRALDNFDANRDRLHLARYEDFKLDKLAYITKLAATLGLEQRQRIDALLDVAFQPSGSGRAPSEFFSEENLAVIARICGPRARRLAYEL